MFQLIYLYFTSPRKDDTAFQSFRTRMKGYIENRNARPETALSDTVTVTMAQYHHRERPLSVELLDEMNLDKSFEIYRDRFRDASDFTFVFIGNFEQSQLKPLVETYLGGLPSLNRDEIWKDIGIYPPKGVIIKEVKKGIESKSQVYIIFTGPFEWSRQNRYDLNSMISALRIKLRETLREDMSGTYGVGISASRTHYPRSEYRFTIGFGCNPERVDELTSAVFSQIDSLKTYGTSEKYLTKVKETQRRARETYLKENSFWLSNLEFYYYHDEDPLGIMDFNRMVDNLSLDAIQQAARKYFDTNNYVKVVLYPE